MRKRSYFISAFLFVTILSLVFLGCESKPVEQPKSEQPKAEADVKSAEPETAKPEEQTAAPVSQPVVQQEAPASPEEMIGENHLPVVQSAKFVAADPKGLALKLEGFDQDGDAVNFKYEWLVNDQKVSEADRIVDVRKDDRVVVNVTPFDGKNEGHTQKLSVVVRNSPPRIYNNEDFEIAEGWLSYQVQAEDPDGDHIQYSLVSGPEGMGIDAESGLVTWKREDDLPAGKYRVTVQATDPTGAASRYSFDVAIAQE
jgi:hypothetical protein